MSESTASAAQPPTTHENPATGRTAPATAQWVESIAPELAAIEQQEEARRGQLKATGRPRSFNAFRVRGILTAIRDGTPKTVAARSYGIDPATWIEWLEQFPKLAHLAERAEALGCVSLVRAVRNGKDIKGQPDWKASAWLLERRHKDHFAAPKASETTVNVNSTTNVLAVDPAALAVLSAAYAQARAGQLPAPHSQQALPPAGDAPDR
jgi:hypothetical protein